MKKAIFLLFFFFVLPSVYAQNEQILDSVSGIYQNVQQDSIQISDFNNNIENASFLETSHFNVFFQGAMWLMFFYNLFFFFMVRDRAYLYYALYILSMALVSVENVYAFTQENPEFYKLMTNFSAVFVTVFYTQFIRYFLNISQISSTLNQYCNYWIYGRVAFTVFVLGWYFSTPELLENNFVLVVFISEIIFGLFLIYKAWKVDPKSTIYLIVGYLVMTFPLAFAILKQIIFESANPQTDGIMVQIGVLLELVVFSLGLGYRSKTAENERLRVSEENRLIIQEQNIVLEQKVKERTEKLNLSLHTVSKQRDDIISSINYALRIQNAIIPKESELQKHLDCFVFFRPKDIVSGDFYWFANKGHTQILVVADCTGHGVSGAFMTMIGNNILNQIVNNQEIYDPHEILNQMPILLGKTLLHSEGKVADGMDISVITFERNSASQGNKISKISYAGAMNPLYYVENEEFKEIKADKVPISVTAKENFSYQKHDFFISEKTKIESTPTTLYLCSDGFQDQFGGDNDKKFMVKNLKKLLFEISEKPIAEQEQILAKTFDDWKGNRKQTDDVLIIGIRAIL